MFLLTWIGFQKDPLPLDLPFGLDIFYLLFLFIKSMFSKIFAVEIIIRIFVVIFFKYCIFKQQCQGECCMNEFFKLETTNTNAVQPMSKLVQT